MKISTSVVAALSLLLASAVTGAAAAPSLADDAKPLRIVEIEYSEDYEGVGRHYSAFATLRGEATRVSARVGELAAQGRLTNSGPGEIWDFTDRAFVKGLRKDLEADGLASVTVKAVGEGATVRKRCSLVLERDDEFGDYAGGDCKRV